MTLVYNVVCQCPLVLVPHCYQMYVEVYKWLLLCQCPLGPLPHFYTQMRFIGKFSSVVVSMPSRADTSFLPRIGFYTVKMCCDMCQCPLGLIPHFYSGSHRRIMWWLFRVSMPSRADTSFLLTKLAQAANKKGCQCPLGLIPHFYITTQCMRYQLV